MALPIKFEEHLNVSSLLPGTRSVYHTAYQPERVHERVFYGRQSADVGNPSYYFVVQKRRIFARSSTSNPAVCRSTGAPGACRRRGAIVATMSRAQEASPRQMDASLRAANYILHAHPNNWSSFFFSPRWTSSSCASVLIFSSFYFLSCETLALRNI